MDRSLCECKGVGEERGAQKIVTQVYNRYFSVVGVPQLSLVMQLKISPSEAPTTSP